MKVIAAMDKALSGAQVRQYSWASKSKFARGLQSDTTQYSIVNTYGCRSHE